MQSDETVYQRIEKLCAQSGITCAELLRSVNLSKSTLTELKMGRSKTLSSKAVTLISEYFNVSIDYIVTGEQPNADNKKAATDDDIKVALFGGDGEVTDEMWKEALDSVYYLVQFQLSPPE